ncbi:MAG: hypothetical protein P4L50_24065 [Anaerolineaceae bacterium]|nr:hypothetical protein [Anaerolineaceae bacterium]
MKILMRNNKSEKWQLVRSAAYANETELQALLLEQPSLISIEEAREGAGTLVAAVREFPLDIGSIDLVGFTANGDITVIECKLATNEEIKRKVIGQVLEYGANLWGMSYEDLDQKIKLRSQKNLADLVREGVEDPDWEEEAFRVNVENALQVGNFILIIVVDQINEDLSRIVRFINDAGRPAFSLAALEMRRFQKEHTEILVPHVFGTVSPDKRPSGGSRVRWTDERFFATISEKLPSEVVKIIRDIYDWTKANSRRVWFGAGAETGSFTFHYLQNEKTVSMFSVYTTGNITINYGWLSTQVDIAIVQNMHKSLTAIPGFRQIPADFTRWPSVKTQEVFVNKPEALSQFKAAIEEFGKNL